MDIIESARTPHLWEKSYGEWKLKIPIWQSV